MIVTGGGQEMAFLPACSHCSAVFQGKL